MKIAITADLHYGLRAAWDESILRLVEHVRGDPPDVLVIAGDIGVGRHFGRCLALFDGIACQKALVPGNHDLWVSDDFPDDDSLALHRYRLPQLAGERGFHYLGHGPLTLGDDLAVAGTINWYDYSWADRAALERLLPNYDHALRNKLFVGGWHNDGKRVVWPQTDGTFTHEVVDRFEGQILECTAPNIIAVTHHPPFRGLEYPKDGPMTADDHLWMGYTGNTRIEAVLAREAARIPFAFCGHTHRACETLWNGIRGFNVGGDYGWKRLLTLDWPGGTVKAREFRAA